MASDPESVVASPYDGMMYGSIVITKMPNPKPMVRCMNAPTKANAINQRIVAIVIINANIAILKAIYQFS